MWQTSYDNKPTLYLVPTPIGNLEDMTYRSVKILNEVSVIFSEDTRVTLNLLNHFEIKKKLIPLHDHNEETVKEKVLSYLKNNENVALVTDRGTPIISDPGYKTVKYITDFGYNVVALPGANAFVPAIVSSGISSEHFMFYGFLNSNESKSKKELEKLKDFEYAFILYEAPHRILKTLNNINKILGPRNISISREISKKYESIFRGNVVDAINNFDDVKGEMVIVVEGAKNKDISDNLSIVESVNIYISNGYSIMNAMKKVAKDKNMSKSDIYKEYQKEK